MKPTIGVQWNRWIWALIIMVVIGLLLFACSMYTLQLREEKNDLDHNLPKSRAILG